jgi:hypothetical protein
LDSLAGVIKAILSGLVVFRSVYRFAKKEGTFLLEQRTTTTDNEQQTTSIREQTKRRNIVKELIEKGKGKSGMLSYFPMENHLLAGL